MAQKVSSDPVVAVPSGNLDAALGYARRGCAVLPVRGKGKAPLTAHGVHDSSTDESVLRGWWARWPSANVGIATGLPSGLIVLDVDGDEGRASLRGLQDEIGPLAPTRRVKTGRGEHLYLACSQPTRTQQLAPGLELRGDGSYVVAPPSRHPSGACYEVIEGAEPAPLPDRLRELLAARFPTRVRLGNQTNIARGERNKALTSLGGTMRRRGMTPEAIETALLAENAARCAPPLPEAEVRRIASSVARYQPAPEPPGGDQGGRPSKESQATRLVSLASDAELFHAPDQTCYATIKVGTHFETWPIRSTTFRRYIAGLYYFAEKKASGSQAIQDALNVFEARALFSSPQRDVFVRVAEHDGSIWLDLGDAEWRAVQISSTGWHIIGNPAVGFRRSRGMLALPAPVLGGTISDMFPFLNLATEEDRALVLPWMVGALRPRGPYPILCLHGEQGTAKSTTARVIRALIDPNVAPLRSLPQEERDLQISARNSHLVSFDNVSRLDDWVSDSLCRLATGGGLATRQLYSDDEEIQESKNLAFASLPITTPVGVSSGKRLSIEILSTRRSISSVYLPVR